MALRELLQGLRGRRTPDHAPPAPNDEQTRAIWLVASWLLQYPDERQRDALEMLDGLIDTLPQPFAGQLREVATVLGDRDRFEVCAEYVETFDTRRRGCLYLTYFSYGDTRRRGMALLDVKQRYRAAGLEVSEDELPDHLCYVLEFGAAHSAEGAREILMQCRAGLELLRVHLGESNSPWHGALAAVCATLPPLRGDDREAIARLAAEGPADEEVGLTDGAEDMPPMDMAPYAMTGAPGGVQGSAGAPAGSDGAGGSGSRAFIPVDSLFPAKGRQR